MRSLHLKLCPLFAFSALSLASVATIAQTPTTCSQMYTGQNSSLGGFLPFPASDPWRQDISNATVDGQSDAIIATIGAAAKMHADFGAGTYYGSTIGIPYQVVTNTPLVPVTFTAYGAESDPGPMPVPSGILIEGYPTVNPNGDRHALVLDRDNCFLYELYNTSVSSTGAVSAASGAIFDLLNNSARPYTWTSTDAAGLPIFPGLARYDEVASGVINHALRFTLPLSKAAIVPPARHWAATSTNPYAAPMGMRLRLRASFDISKFSPQAKVILTALKKYGMILADNGSAMYLSGAPSESWNNDDLHTLAGVTAANFEVVQESPLYTSANVPTGAAPKINSFTSTKGQRGRAGTLQWNVSGASYVIISPAIGAVRRSSVSVSPTSTTTYTIYATNGFGRTTATTTLTLP